MKKIIIVVFLIGISGSAQNTYSPQSSWIHEQLSADNYFGGLVPYDKTLHLLAGAAIAATTYHLVYDWTEDRAIAFIAGNGAALLAGIGKELIDSTQESNRFDIRDAGATLGGALIVTVPIELFNKTKRDARKKAKDKILLDYPLKL